MVTAYKKPRRPKPVNYGNRRTLRLGKDEEAAVEHMRRALAKNRGVEVEKIKFSEALRLLLGENLRAARVLAGHPEALPRPDAIDLPIEFWDGLTECRNRLSHSQGSLYAILRKLNLFHEVASKDEFRKAFEAMQESKAAVARLEQRAVFFVTDPSPGAGAEDDPEAA